MKKLKKKRISHDFSMSYEKVHSSGQILTKTTFYHYGCLCKSEENSFIIGLEKYENIIIINNMKYNICCCLTGSQKSFIRRENISNIVISQGICNRNCVFANHCGMCKYHDLQIFTGGSPSFPLKIHNDNITKLVNWYNEPARQVMEEM